MRLAENTGHKKLQKIRHLGTIAQPCQAASSQPRHVLTTTTVLWPFVQDYPGEPVPEETFTQPPT